LKVRGTSTRIWRSSVWSGSALVPEPVKPPPPPPPAAAGELGTPPPLAAADPAAVAAALGDVGVTPK